MSRNNNYTTGNVSDYFCHQNCDKLIGNNFSRQKDAAFPHKLEGDFGATMLFIAKKQQKTIPNFSLNSLNITE